MKSCQGGERRRLQFSIRTALFTMLFVALSLGSYRVYRENMVLLRRLSQAHSETQLQKLRTRIGEVPQGKVVGLSTVCLDGAYLHGMSIIGGMFQSTSFKGSDLSGTTLTGGAASFQGARFDSANLTNATLTGGGASFQVASFVNADLTKATLTGGASSFQGASFEGAKLIDARVVVSGAGDFQSVNIDGAQFQGADLSTINPRSLESCYFDTSPCYNKKTRFPSGFDAAAQGWVREEQVGNPIRHER